MQVLVLTWLIIWVNASTEKKYFELFPNHIMCLTIKYLEIDDYFELILQSKLFYSTYHSFILDAISQRYPKKLASLAHMSPFTSYRALAFIQAAIKQESTNIRTETPITRNHFIMTTLLVLFNGNETYPEIKRSDLSEQAQIFNYFLENKYFFSYTGGSFHEKGEETSTEFYFGHRGDIIDYSGHSRLPLVYDPCFGNLWIYDKSFDDPTNVILRMKLHIPATLHFVKKFGGTIDAERITTCRCKKFIAFQNKTWAEMDFKSTKSISGYTYKMVFDKNGFLEKIKIFKRIGFISIYEFVKKNEYSFYISIINGSETKEHSLIISTIYTSYYPLASETLYQNLK